LVINIPRGTVHGFAFSAGTEGVVLSLPADDFPDLFAAPAETARVLARVFQLAADPDLTRRVQALARTHAGSGAFRRTLLRAEACLLLAGLAEGAQAVQGEPVRQDPRIQRFESMVRGSLTRRFNLTELAEALALSPRTLSRLCKAETGLTAQGYFEAQKMREACRLLVYTRMSAQAIAYQLGFDDPSYFSRVFQRNLSLSPGAYRRRFEHSALLHKSRAGFIS
jgi:AraC family transcriptional activator of pobA